MASTGRTTRSGGTRRSRIVALMTMSPVRDSLVLGSPDALVAALPYLIGFTPHESLVALWIAAGQIQLTQRLDLAGWSADPGAWEEALWGHPCARTSDSVVAVAATKGELPSGLLASVRAAATQRGTALLDVLILDRGRWRSALCHDDHCCPAVGRLVDPRVHAEVAAEFTIMGAAPSSDRQALVASLARDDVAVKRVASVLDAAQAPTTRSRSRLESWRDDTIELILARLSPSTEAITNPPLDADDACVVVGLSDVRVRDTVLWHLAATDPDGLQHALRELTRLLRAAPDPVVAPVATTCAVVAWLLGDGARAGIAVDRALATAPDYTLALLVAHSLAAGLPPGSWRAAMASVTLDECRNGQANGRRKAG